MQILLGILAQLYGWIFQVVGEPLIQIVLEVIRDLVARSSQAPPPRP